MNNTMHCIDRGLMNDLSHLLINPAITCLVVWFLWTILAIENWSMKATLHKNGKGGTDFRSH